MVFIFSLDMSASLGHVQWLIRPFYLKPCMWFRDENKNIYTMRYLFVLSKITSYS